LLGVIIGIIVVIAAVPSLTKIGVFPDKWTGQGTQSGQTEQLNANSLQGDVGPAKSKYVNVDVTSQLTKIVEEVSPAVVGVSNLQKQGDFWEQQGEEESEAGTGSGVIYKKENGYAYVVTNHHVVEG